MTVPVGEVSFSDVTLDYRLYHDRTVTIFETLLNLFGRRTSREWFRALDSVSFSIAPGESVALIGANGAGKSTTLKLLAGIYLPTSGRVSAGGRIASLLDLGVGFHPELTGAENVYLNGALLGLSRSQMKDLLPEIAHFSELERFMDTPVKYYSAGMFMRLGFGLATSVEPDLLLIDEVLAVGDSSFQEKCYDRIFGFRGSGKTIVFVSHDSVAVSRLCDRAIWLDAGRIVMDGPVQDVLSEYLSTATRIKTTASVAPREWGTREGYFDSVRLTDSTGTVSHSFRAGESLDPIDVGESKAGPLVCYEDIFPEISRGLVKRGAEYLVNVTNDAWYGISSAPYQHLALAVFRAVENRRFMIRATNTGGDEEYGRLAIIR